MLTCQKTVIQEKAAHSKLFVETKISNNICNYKSRQRGRVVKTPGL